LAGFFSSIFVKGLEAKFTLLSLFLFLWSGYAYGVIKWWCFLQDRGR
jgi:hypothetical protein